jgi:hypothetical protein
MFNRPLGRSTMAPEEVVSVGHSVIRVLIPVRVVRPSPRNHSLKVPFGYRLTENILGCGKARRDRRIV